MFNILRRLAITTLLITAVLALSPVAWAANEPSKTDSAIPGGTVTITNNYAATDYLEITLSDRATVNTAFWVFHSNGPLDKSGQIGTVTVKKGSTTGKLTISAGKLTDLTAGTVVIKPASGADTYECDYDEAAETTVNTTGKVTLRNTPTGAKLLIVDASIVEKGMIAYAVVNGKIYKATASKDGAPLQVSLAANMEEGASVWYTIAAAGCKDIGYEELLLGPVEVTDTLAATDTVLFFQGDGSPSSSLLVKNVNPGDTIRCTFENTTSTGAVTIVKKSATVPAGNTVVFVTGMKLAAGDIVAVTITEKGKLESPPLNVTVPTMVASKKPVSSAITVKRTTETAATADITVKNVADGDIVKIYDATGNTVLGTQTASIPAPGPGEEPVTKVNLEFTGINIGTDAATIYVSVTSDSLDESPWLKITVKAASSVIVAVTGVTLNESTLTLDVGDSRTLSATVAPSNAANKSLTWSSSDDSVATVDNNGKVTAVADGTATITATTVDGNKTATCLVNVTAAP